MSQHRIPDLDDISEAAVDQDRVQANRRAASAQALTEALRLRPDRCRRTFNALVASVGDGGEAA